MLLFLVVMSTVKEALMESFTLIPSTKSGCKVSIITLIMLKLITIVSKL